MTTLLPPVAVVPEMGVLDFLGNAILLGPQGLGNALSIAAESPSETVLENTGKILRALEPALASEGLDTKPLKRVLEETGTVSASGIENLSLLRLAAVLGGYSSERYRRAVSHPQMLEALSGSRMVLELNDPHARRLRIVQQGVEKSFAASSFERQYDVLQRLSVSSLTVTELVQEKRTGKLFTARRTANPIEMEKLKEEFAVLQNLDHPGIVSEIKLFSDEKETVMILDYLPGGKSVAEFLSHGGRCSESDLSDIFEQLLGALQHIHSHGVVHQNIHPGNVLIYKDGERMRVQLFGFSAPKFLGQRGEMRMGEDTDYWMSPEQLAGGTITRATDIYNLGLFLLAMVIGKPMQIDDQNPKATVAQVRQQSGGYLSSGFLDLLEMLVDADPQTRLGVLRQTRMAALVAVPRETQVASSAAQAVVPYFSSAEALSHLCHANPDSPISYGIGKVLGGAGLLAATGGIVYFTNAEIGPAIMDGFRRIFSHHTWDVTDYVGIVMQSIFSLMIVGIGLGSAGAGLYMGADGIFSLLKPFREEGDVIRGIYYRNGGYTNKPSWPDRIFGTRIFPVDAIDEGMKTWDGSFLLNNVIVRKTGIKADTYYVPVVVGKITTMQEHTSYTVTVAGNLNGQEIRAYAVTEDEDFAERLAGLSGGSRIYLIGKLDKDGYLDVDRFGEAIAETYQPA